MAKLNFISILILISFGLFAQGKLYFTPSVRFLVSAYSGVDSVNSRQNFLKTKPFTRKDFLIGGSFMYSNKNYTIKLGLDEGVYSSGHYYDKERQNAAPNQIYSVSKETLSSVDGPYTIYLEYARTFKKMANLKMPN